MSGPGPRRIGRCLCSAISCVVAGPARALGHRHCSQCRRQAGHACAAAAAVDSAVAIQGPVAWFRSSPDIAPGFCPRRGSSLFPRRDGTGEIEVSLDSMDTPTGLRLARRIHVPWRGNHCGIVDGLPQDP